MDLERYVAERSSATSLGLYGSSDLVRGLAALEAAARAVVGIPHPDDPDRCLPNWCTAIMRGGVPVFHLDMQDNRDYAGRVARILLDSIAAAGADGRLEPYRWPDPGYEADHRAEIFAGERANLDGRGLLPGFPDGFPVPDDAEPVLAQRLPDGGEHVAWSRDGAPLADYPQRLRAFGCELGPASAGDRTEALGMTRLALWRDGAGGTLSLYREPRWPGHLPTRWYASVVWRPTADRPRETVDGPPGGWPGPPEFDAAAAHRLAASLVPAEHADGIAMLLAFGEANAVLEPVMRSVGRGRAALAPLVAHAAPLLRPLTDRQRAAIRDVSMVLTANWAVAGTTHHVKPPTVAVDADGYRYEATARGRFLTVLDPAGTDVAETALSILEPARFLQNLLRDLRAGRCPDPGLLARLLADLDPDRVAAATGACWLIPAPAHRPRNV